jgi:hypothetical protein
VAILYGTQNHRASGLCALFEIVNNATFRKLDMFPSSSEGSETPTVLGPLERSGSVTEISAF